MLERHSSCVGSSWCHAMFKIKYCHEIFDIEEVRMFVYDMLVYISVNYNMPIKKVGFDSDHVHFRVDIKLRSKPEAAKIFRGITGKFILKKFPEVKQKYFGVQDSGTLHICLTISAMMKNMLMIILPRKNILLINSNSTSL